jgi:hypothetical protein
MFVCMYIHTNIYIYIYIYMYGYLSCLDKSWMEIGLAFESIQCDANDF